MKRHKSKLRSKKLENKNKNIKSLLDCCQIEIETFVILISL